MARIVGIIDHIYAEVYWFVGSEFYVYLSHLIINHLIQNVEHLLWHYHCVVQTTWKHSDGLRSNIIFATYGSTCGDSGQALSLSSEVELRQSACVLCE